MHDAGSVDSALSLLRQHLARPSGIFDPHAALAALEQLVDVARDKSDERASDLVFRSFVSAVASQTGRG